MRNTPKPRGIDQIKTHPPSETPQSSFTVKGDNANLELTVHKPIKTLEQLIKVCEIDTETWEVERYTCNKWEVAGFNKKTEHFTVQELWQVKATLKKRVDALALKEIGAHIVAEIKKYSPKTARTKVKKYNDPCLAEIDFFDLHFGKLAWGKETGEDYDLKIARKRFEDALSDMINKLSVYNVEKFLFPIGNDFLNSNSSLAETFSGTPMSEDDRWKKTFGEGWKMLFEGITKLSTIAPVDVIVIPGNHDFESAFYLGEVISAAFTNNPNVNVDNSPPIRKYYRYGNNLIGFTHGKEEKITELPLIMASERSKDFSETKYREWHLGDKHHKKDYHFLSTNEIKGVVVRILRSLTSADEWHFKKGYIGAVKAGESFVWNKDQGLICNLSVNL